MSKNMPKEFLGKDGRYYQHSEALSDIYGAGPRYLVFKDRQECHDETAVQSFDSENWNDINDQYDENNDMSARYQIVITIGGRKIEVETDARGNLITPIGDVYTARTYIKNLRNMYRDVKVRYTDLKN